MPSEESKQRHGIQGQTLSDDGSTLRYPYAGLSLVWLAHIPEYG